MPAVRYLARYKTRSYTTHRPYYTPLIRRRNNPRKPADALQWLQLREGGEIKHEFHELKHELHKLKTNITEEKIRTQSAAGVQNILFKIIIGLSFIKHQHRLSFSPCLSASACPETSWVVPFGGVYTECAQDYAFRISHISQTERIIKSCGIERIKINF